jgi:hypothetical protein
MNNIDYIKEFVTSYKKGEFTIRYGNAMSLGNAEEFIARHICENYPEKGYGNKGNILGKRNSNFSKTAWEKIHKLSMKDDRLQQLIQNFVECAQYVER